MRDEGVDAVEGSGAVEEFLGGGDVGDHEVGELGVGGRREGCDTGNVDVGVVAVDREGEGVAGFDAEALGEGGYEDDFVGLGEEAVEGVFIHRGGDFCVRAEFLFGEGIGAEQVDFLRLLQWAGGEEMAIDDRSEGRWEVEAGEIDVFLVGDAAARADDGVRGAIGERVDGGSEGGDAGGDGEIDSDHDGHAEGDADETERRLQRVFAYVAAEEFEGEADHAAPMLMAPRTSLTRPSSRWSWSSQISAASGAWVAMTTERAAARGGVRRAA